MIIGEILNRFKVIIYTKVCKKQIKRDIEKIERELGITDDLVNFDNANIIVGNILSKDFNIVYTGNGMWFINMHGKHIGDLLLNYKNNGFNLSCDVQYLHKILTIFKKYGYIINTYGCKHDW